MEKLYRRKIGKRNMICCLSSVSWGWTCSDFRVFWNLWHSKGRCSIEIQIWHQLYLLWHDRHQWHGQSNTFAICWAPNLNEFPSPDAVPGQFEYLSDSFSNPHSETLITNGWSCTPVSAEQRYMEASSIKDRRNDDAWRILIAPGSTGSGIRSLR